MTWIVNKILAVFIRIFKNSSPHPAFKILGVWLDENLKFDYHVSVTKKSGKSSVLSK